MIMGSRTLALFAGSLLVVSWALQVTALVVVGDVNSDAMLPWLVGVMFVPTLWSIGYLTLFNRSAWRLVRFWPGNPLWLILAALIPAAIAFATLGLSLAFNWGASDYFTLSQGGAQVLRGPWVMGDGVQTWPFFAANVLSTAIVFAALNSIAAVGEEFGWRGVLQHHFIERMGFMRGVAVLGFIWAVWHLPVNLAGYNYSEAPVLGALVLFPIELIAISFIMAWLTLRARSFWPAVLMHGSGNGIEEGVVSSIGLDTALPPLTVELAQIAVSVALAIVCVLLTPRQPRGQVANPSPATA